MDDIKIRKFEIKSLEKWKIHKHVPQGKKNLFQINILLFWIK